MQTTFAVVRSVVVANLRSVRGYLPIRRLTSLRLLPLSGARGASCEANAVRSASRAPPPRSTSVAPLPMRRRAATRRAVALVRVGPGRPPACPHAGGPQPSSSTLAAPLNARRRRQRPAALRFVEPSGITGLLDPCPCAGARGNPSIRVPSRWCAWALGGRPRALTRMPPRVRSHCRRRGPDPAPQCRLELAPGSADPLDPSIPMPLAAFTCSRWLLHCRRGARTRRTSGSRPAGSRCPCRPPARPPPDS